MRMAIEILDLWDNMMYTDYAGHITTVFVKPTIDDAVKAIEQARQDGFVVRDFFGKKIDYDVSVSII